MTVFFFGGLGLIIGSFLNVVIAREGSEENIGGRSHCATCRHELAALDLVPVLSWLALRARCRYCGSRISLQYPLVELLTALLFLGIGLSPLHILLKILGLVIVSLAICIAVYDLKYMLMPDMWNYAFAGAALLYGVLAAPDVSALWYVLFAGPLCAFPLWALWYFSGGRWMGLGDVKFALGIGWLLGPLYGFVALLFAFVIGAVVSVCILLPLGALISYAQQRGITLLSRTPVRFTMKSEVPFGPFLVVSCITIWYVHVYGIALPLIW
jgi:leader peptidase (prepilin peptidase)/N-methyltransferase